MMTVRVRLFAFLRDAAGVEACHVVLKPGARGLEVKARLIEQYHPLEGWMSCARLAINNEYRPWETSLHDGDEVALIPPVSGG